MHFNTRNKAFPKRIFCAYILTCFCMYNFPNLCFLFGHFSSIFVLIFFLLVHRSSYFLDFCTFFYLLVYSLTGRRSNNVRKIPSPPKRATRRSGPPLPVGRLVLMASGGTGIGSAVAPSDSNARGKRLKGLCITGMLYDRNIRFERFERQRWYEGFCFCNQSFYLLLRCIFCCDTV